MKKSTATLWAEAINLDPPRAVALAQDFAIYGAPGQWPEAVKIMFRSELRAVVRSAQADHNEHVFYQEAFQ